MSVPDVREIRADANGTMWRLRSLIAMGHDMERLALALGVSPGAVQRVVRGESRTVTPALRSLTVQLWVAWWCYMPPERTAAERRTAGRARGMARRSNWPCPLGLDEDMLDVPGYRPYSGWRRARGLGVAPAFGAATGTQRGREMAS